MTVPNQPKSERPDPAYAMSLNTPNALAFATKVTYKKGVVTDIQGMEKRTVELNQIIKIKGSVGRSIDGRLDEIVQEGVSLYSPKKITIESTEKVEIISPGEYYEYKNASASLKLNDISVNLTSASINPLFGFSFNGLKFENKAAVMKREGGTFKIFLGGTETRISTFSQYISALTSFC